MSYFSHSLEAQLNSLNQAFCFEASDRSLNSEALNLKRSTPQIYLQPNLRLIVSQHSSSQRALRQTLFRLGTKIIAARVHLGTGSWLIVSDDRPRLSRGAEREIAQAIDWVLRVVKPEKSKEKSFQSAH